jgi:hypothetical protein
MIFSKISIVYFNLVSPGEGVVRIDYYDGRLFVSRLRNG